MASIGELYALVSCADRALGSMALAAIGIHVLSPGDENDAKIVELVHDVEEVLNASRDSVNRGDEHDGEFLPPC
ncbi:MAG: hypothetical protein WA653_08850, partial [Candidatus Sulfotelmatobacter sp.]